MVYAVGVEVLLHLAETAHPPRAAVGQHLVPVVGGESPVLSVGREGIGRSTGLPVEVEVAGLHPGLHAVARDADGDVTFQYHAMRARIRMSSTHLTVEVVLYVVPEIHLLLGLLGNAAPSGPHVAHLVGPRREGGRAVEVAEITEGSVRHQPVLVLLEKQLVSVAALHGRPLLGERLAQVGYLRGKDALVVNLRQLVQLHTQGLELLPLLLVFQGWQLAQVAVLRMQGVDADGVVGIGVLPGAGDEGVVDREHLQDALLGLVAPVNHELQVAEVAHAKAALAAQREDGDDGAGTLPRVDREEGLWQLVDHHAGSLLADAVDGAVHAVLPDGHLFAILVQDDELELEEARQLVSVEADNPLMAVMLNHGQGLIGVPVAQVLGAADNA